MKLIITTFCLVLGIFSVQAQIKTPSSSPLSTITQKVGVSEIELSYSRPGIKERTIFAKDGLVPFGEYWRLGANSPTKIKVSDDITIEGKTLVKGEYVILAIPNDREWKINFYAKEKGGWNKYIERSPVLELSSRSEPSSHKIESLLIYFDNIKMNSADLIIHWDRTLLRTKIEVEVHDKVMANINKVMQGPSDFDYFNAASYLYSADQDMETALKYIQVASKGEKPTFFFARREATILAKLKRYKEAIAVAKTSTVLAEKVGNVDVVKLNNKSIEEWSQKINK